MVEKYLTKESSLKKVTVLNMAYSYSQRDLLIYTNRMYEYNKKCASAIAQITSLQANVLFALAVMENDRDKKVKKKYKSKKCWVCPIYQLREKHGFANAILPTLALDDEMHRNYMRMDLAQFNELLHLVGPTIKKQPSKFRDPIPITSRLALTLRYLATGDNMFSMSYSYLIGHTTACNIINETCLAIWNCLRRDMLPYPLNVEDWLKIASDFESIWNFNHCVGAIDGKHVLIQCPDNAGSSFFNYKNSHSVVLLAICDANYLFTFVDIGAYGRRSDGGIFRDSLVGQKFSEGKMSLPDAKKLQVDGDPLPFVLVGDEAFQLSDYLLRPYPGRGTPGALSQENKIFNYRLSRARRTIENAFGIAVSRWRVLKRPMESTVDNTISIIQAIVCLHNWLIKKNSLIKGTSRGNNTINSQGYSYPTDFTDEDNENIIANSALQNMYKLSSNNGSKNAMRIREGFSDFFNNEGAVPWQYKHI